MPRTTSEHIVNKLAINDAISGDTITLKYRLPTTDERVKYQKALIRRKGKKVTAAIGETRQKFGAAILTGFEEGDFAKIQDGKELPYSADPASDRYDPNWKKMICMYASDLVEFLAQQVFEGNTREVDLFPDDEDDADEGEDDAEDFSPKNL